MVIQEDEASGEASIPNQTKKYIVVKNHVRELLPNIESSFTVDCENKDANKVKSKVLKRNKDTLKVSPNKTKSEDISESDLNELKTVYKQCKSVLRKIESKYGHLLDLDDEECIKWVNKSEYTSAEPESNNCTCLLKKKIVFDDNGLEIEKECQLENHICPKKVKRTHSDTQPQSSVKVEYDNISFNLPDSLQELENILKDLNIDRVLRNKVIDKIYLLRQEYLNAIRFERHSLVEKLKTNPDELLNFKGTNISTLPGYPTKPLINDKTEKK